MNSPIRTTALMFILSLFIWWGCGEPHPSVMEMVLPDKDMPAAEPPAVTMADVKTTPAEAVTAAEQPSETPPVTIEEEPPPPPVEPVSPEMPDLGLALEMDAIMASEGQVHSPIPDAVYEQLWGNWTKAGSLAPRKFYKKFIDADGIAIVGSENVEDRSFQKARHVVLVITSKLPGLREALSADQVGGVTGDESPFRLVLTHRPSQDFVNMPEHLNANLGNTIYWYGSFHGYYARVDVKDIVANSVLIHEMAHAIEHAIRARNLLPNFGKRLDTAWERE